MAAKGLQGKRIWIDLPEATDAMAPESREAVLPSLGRVGFPRPSTIHQKAAMKITREWIESVSDEKGLTPGQQKVLATWTNPPIVGATIPDHIARFVEGCKGYRGALLTRSVMWRDGVGRLL